MQEFFVCIRSHGEVRNFLGRCFDGFALAVEISLHMDADFLLRSQLIHEVFKGSPAFKIICIPRNTGGEKFHLIIVCAKRYRGKEHSHISHSSHVHTLVLRFQFFEEFI